MLAGILWPGGLLRHTDAAAAPDRPRRPHVDHPAAGADASRATPCAGTTVGDTDCPRPSAVTGRCGPRRRSRPRAPFPLDPFQVRALDALDVGRSVLVAAPTGSGKTLVAEYAIAKALAAGGKTFYTTPLKALSNQKFGDFVRAHGADQRRAAHRRQRRSTATRRSS